MSAIAIQGGPSLPASGALAPYLRVKLSAGVLVVADESDTEVGVLNDRILTGDTKASVTPIDDGNPRWMIAAGSFAQFATLYSAAGGKIDDSGTYVRGIALTASTGDGDRVMVLPVRNATTGLLARASLVQDDLQPYSIPNEAWTLFDSAIHAPLGATALSADDLIYTLGTIGTTAPVITGTDFGGTNATQKARVRVVIPAEYVAGQTITLRVNAGTLTTVADTSSTIDFNVYRQAAPTVDICATAAQSINSLSLADKDFTLTPTDCVPGDVLDILMTYAGVDAGNLGVILPTISGVKLLYDIKG